jgi:hypothetical protein
VATSEKSVPTLLSELKDLVVAYAKQETVDPLRHLLRFLLFGLIGAVFISIGVVLLALAVLRAIQTEAGAHLSGDWTWVPYAGGVLFALIVAGVAASRIAKVPR